MTDVSAALHNARKHFKVLERTMDSVTDRKSAIRAMHAFFGRNGVDGIECPSGFKGFKVEAVNLRKRPTDDGPSGRIYAFMLIGDERIPVRGYILDGRFAALVTLAAFLWGPKRERRLEARKRIVPLLRAFRSHFEEWHRDDGMALMFQSIESFLKMYCPNIFTAKRKKGG